MQTLDLFAWWLRYGVLREISRPDTDPRVGPSEWWLAYWWWRYEPIEDET